LVTYIKWLQYTVCKILERYALRELFKTSNSLFPNGGKMKIPTRLMVCFALAAFFADSIATTIVLIRNQDAVYIGADSKIVDENGDSLGEECKVIKIGDYYFANAGLGMDLQYDFNIKEIATTVFSSNASFEQQLSDFVDAVDYECSSYLLRIKNNRKDIFERVTSGKINIETAIAGRDENGIPFFKVIKFRADKFGNETKISTPIRYNCPGDCADGKVVAIMGQMSNTESFVDNWARGMMRNPVKAIKFIINKEIEKSDRVGPPITILEISEKKSTWLQHDNLCPDN
jgi:hypothetical protein